MRFLFLIFVIVPLIEMMLLFEVSDLIGGFTTIFLVVFTAALGIQILKQQGFSTLLRANERMASGELPAQEIVEGMMLAAAGALLLTPGFITDTIGFILLTGPLRRPLARRVIKAGVMNTMGASGGGFTTWSGGAPGGSHGGSTYEGEYSRESDSRLNKPSEAKDRDSSE